MLNSCLEQARGLEPEACLLLMLLLVVLGGGLFELLLLWLWQRRRWLAAFDRALVLTLVARGAGLARERELLGREVVPRWRGCA